MLRKLTIILLFIALGLSFITACHSTMLGLDSVDLSYKDKPFATPELRPKSLEAWQTERAEIKAKFEALMYGDWPNSVNVETLGKRTITPDFEGGVLEEWTLDVGRPDYPRRVRMAVALPDIKTAPKAIILALSFGSQCSVFPNTPLKTPAGETCEGDPMDSFMGRRIKHIFGEYISKAPIEQYFANNIGYANIYASAIVPDDAKTAPAILEALSPDAVHPTGALIAWAFVQSQMARVLANDPRIGDTRFASLGHSRFGKAALIAAAWSDDIDMALSLQSGFGGAALNRSKTGETVTRMVQGADVLGGLIGLPGYPHWLTPSVASWIDAPENLPIDQHMLLALIAPKPVLLANGRKDVWSDPNSVFRAAIGANPVYEIYGKTGLGAETLEDFKPKDEIAYILTSDGHGVRADDIGAIIKFMNAHTRV